MALPIAARGRATLPAARTLPLFALVSGAFATWRQRRALAELPDHLREDVGLTDADIRRETNRPLWDVPHHWLV